MHPLLLRKGRFHNHSFFLQFHLVQFFLLSSILKKTTGDLDLVHPRYIKDTADIISNTLAYIVNLIFRTAVFPQELKRSKIFPVFKKGDNTSLKNYRPIFILSFFSKVIEKLFEQGVLNYFKKFDILTPREFFFHPGSSTNFALIALADQSKKAIDEGKPVGSLFVDFSKAFDSINHNILFQKLASYGIVGVPLNLIRNYLLDREETLNVSGTISD